MTLEGSSCLSRGDLTLTLTTMTGSEKSYGLMKLNQPFINDDGSRGVNTHYFHLERDIPKLLMAFKTVDDHFNSLNTFILQDH